MMKSYKKLFMSVACATLMLGSFGVKAEDQVDSGEFSSKIASGENVVLFKIHDVTPIKNEDGVLTDCEFGLTLYNRSPKSVDSATIDLSWADEGISSVIDDEDKKENDEIAAGKVNSFTQARQPKTETFETKTLTTSVVLPQIKPFRQVSLKSKIKSDRCFLMIENAEFSFSNCAVSDTSASTGSGRRLVSGGRTSGMSECQTLFRFVSPKDPEYYREFQKVSFNEEAAQRLEARKKDIDELEENYNQMMKNLGGVVETLDSIK